tara:strand:+ start:2264 stop:2686 length:423 start_codon:yes stop_codon:yes gene_type:complete
MSCGLTKLPDFTTKKIDMLTAAKMLKDAIDKNCKEMGMDPKWETNMATADKYGQGSDEVICVNFEAGPHDWGVNYSLGSNPESYKMHGNIQDWYLECYYGFDVMFVSTLEKPKKYKNVVVGKPPAQGLICNYTCEDKEAA